MVENMNKCRGFQVQHQKGRESEVLTKYITITPLYGDYEPRNGVKTDSLGIATLEAVEEDSEGDDEKYRFLKKEEARTV